MKMAIGKKDNTINIIDIGSTKIVCFIAEYIGDQLCIIGIGQAATHGLRGSIITDVKQITRSIQQAVATAEKMAERKIRNVHISLSANVLTSQHIELHANIFNKGITPTDINKMHAKINEQVDISEFNIVYSKVLHYTLDGNSGIDNPIGMYGKSLTCHMNILTCPKNILVNLENCLLSSNLALASVIPSAIATAHACLREDEMDTGCILIELGSSVSSITAFRNGGLLYSYGITVGGNNITNDIVQIIGTNFIAAEKIKTLYGSLQNISPEEDHSNLEIPEDTDSINSEVGKKLIADIIRARVEEIFELLFTNLMENMPEFRHCRIVITGGSTKLSHFTDFARQYFAQNVRIIEPCYINGIAENVSSHGYATPIGMLKYLESKLGINKEKIQESGMKKVLHWLKENF